MSNERLIEIQARLKTIKEEIQDRIRGLQEESKQLNKELDTFRTKCPTCRCWLLPEEKCGCCWEAELYRDFLDDREDRIGIPIVRKPRKPLPKKTST